ncbi:hypothetical protein CCP1ISM_110004 [Azospirillaceae bacterium]
MSQLTIPGGNIYSDDRSTERDMKGGGFKRWLLPMLGEAIGWISAQVSVITGAASTATAAAGTATGAAGTATTAAGTATGAATTATTARDLTLQYRDTAQQAAATATGAAATAAAAQGAVGGLRVSATDTTAGHLLDKLLPGTGLLLTRDNAGGAETLTAAVDVGTSAGKIVQVQTGGKLPALDGSLLTNLPIAPPGIAFAAVSAKTATYTAVAGDAGKLLACSGTWTLSLTEAATLGAGWTVGVANTGAGTITIDPAGSETISGRFTWMLFPFQSCLVVCDGAGFAIIGTGAAGLSATTLSPTDKAGEITLSGGQSHRRHHRHHFARRAGHQLGPHVRVYLHRSALRTPRRRGRV